MDMQETSQAGRWRVRFAICCMMLVLAFIGAVLMDLHSRAYLFYSQVICVVYAVLSLSLFIYSTGGFRCFIQPALWRQLCHWLGLMVALYLIDLFVQSGLISNTGAGVVTIMLLALVVFAIGLYHDITFIFIGLVLGVLSACLALVQHYFSLVMIPVLLIAVGIIFWLVNRD